MANHKNVQITEIYAEKGIAKARELVKNMGDKNCNNWAKYRNCSGIKKKGNANLSQYPIARRISIVRYVLVPTYTWLRNTK